MYNRHRRGWPYWYAAGGLLPVISFALFLGVFVIPFRWPKVFRAVLGWTVLLLPIGMVLGMNSGLFDAILLGVAWHISGRKELWIRSPRPPATANRTSTFRPRSPAALTRRSGSDGIRPGHN